MLAVVVTFGSMMSPLERIVRVAVVAIEEKLKLPVPVKLTLLPAAGARATLPPTEWTEPEV